MERLKESQLIINPDGTIYHLNIRPEDIADTILLVGDPGRVHSISKHFNKIEVRAQNREMVTHTGFFKGKRITAISTGIGPDNIDIVVNELDALANVDFKNRVYRSKPRPLNLIRVGTSGTIQPDIAINSFGLAEYAMGLDNVFMFYKKASQIFEHELAEEFIKQSSWPNDLPHPYVVRSTDTLAQLFRNGMHGGITLTAPGFYGPQGRKIRLDPSHPNLNEKISKFRFGSQRIINYEMESSALYSLGRLLGHCVVTVCVILANRATEEYTSDPVKPMETLIELVLDRITTL